MNCFPEITLRWRQVRCSQQCYRPTHAFTQAYLFYNVKSTDDKLYTRSYIYTVIVKFLFSWENTRQKQTLGWLQPVYFYKSVYLVGKQCVACTHFHVVEDLSRKLATPRQLQRWFLGWRCVTILLHIVMYDWSIRSVKHYTCSPHSEF
jgi:hypothetical protein